MKKVLKKAAVLLLAGAMALTGFAGVKASAADDVTIEPGRNIQEEGVGNPYNFGERNTPSDASIEEIRKINHNMSVKEVKFALYKEIDEHWDLIKLRFGETDREKVYALFLGLGTRESTLGGNGDGADIETAFSEGFGVSSAHAYGTMQTAVTAFADADPTFTKEEDVPEMYQYKLTQSNFYDAIISNHMGIRKLMHFVNQAITNYNLSGFQVVRAALKGFNTGWANYTGDDDGYYKNYPDEIAAMAHWYYDEGHLYDDVFTWTGDQRADKYRAGVKSWDWWSDCNPSMAKVGSDVPKVTTADPNTQTGVTTTTSLKSSYDQQFIPGDINNDFSVSVADVVILQKFLIRKQDYSVSQLMHADMDKNNKLNAKDLTLLKQKLFNQSHV